MNMLTLTIIQILLKKPTIVNLTRIIILQTNSTRLILTKLQIITILEDSKEGIWTIISKVGSILILQISMENSKIMAIMKTLILMILMEKKA